MLANLVLPDGTSTGLNALGEPSDKLHSIIRVTYWRGLIGLAKSIMCSADVEGRC